MKASYLESFLKFFKNSYKNFFTTSEYDVVACYNGFCNSRIIL